MKKYKFKHGVTLIELIIVVALMGLVIVGSFSLFNLANVSSSKNKEDSFIVQDSRLFLVYLDREIRQANRPVLLKNLPVNIDDSNFPEEVKSKKAVEVENSGDILVIYTYLNDNPKRVTYRARVENGFNILEKNISDPHILTSDITDWNIIFESIEKYLSRPYFRINPDNQKKIEINMSVYSKKENLNLDINTFYTVRGKEAMQ